ncbi:MAG: mechanosensitive ion channel [Flavobacteriales bacterium]|nr:mechanosensitive ion channel [Flavobacteriales bacterium]MCC6936749.1 mechanosensitive ion channel [Flavobacteriales bacterium]
MNEFLQHKLLDLGYGSLTTGQLISALLVLAGTWALLRVLRSWLDHRWGHGDHGNPRVIAVYKLVSYFFWTGTILLALDMVGVRLTFLLAGGAALLVGLGLGIQQTFNDIISGIIILAEGMIKVGDVMEVDGTVGRVTDINLRTTKVLTRDDIHLLVPNHKFINENVINWSHTDMVTRFHIGVGVAYGTDARLVERVLIQCANAHPAVLSDDHGHSITVRLVDFGDSSLDFEVLFYSRNVFRIETTKSEIRFAIVDAFKENGITIPFPQRDVHMYPTGRS